MVDVTFTVKDEALLNEAWEAENSAIRSAIYATIHTAVGAAGTCATVKYAIKNGINCWTIISALFSGSFLAGGLERVNDTRHLLMKSAEARKAAKDSGIECTVKDDNDSTTEN